MTTFPPVIKALSVGALCLGWSTLTSLDAATLMWDAQSGTAGQQDGSGTWNSSGTNWIDSISGLNQAWEGGNTTIASFGVTPVSSATNYTVTLAEAMELHGLTFNAINNGHYRLVGGSANHLTLVGQESGETVIEPKVILNTPNASLDVSLRGTAGFSMTANNAGNRLSLVGTQANTNTGLIDIRSGELYLNKTAGVTAIAGDVVINGGTLRWNVENQVADTASITLNSGTLYIGGKTDTIKNLTINGGTNNGGTNSNSAVFTVSDTLTIGSATSFGMNSSASWNVGRLVLMAPPASSATNALSITGNAGNAAGGVMASLTVGAGGIEMESRIITLNTGENTNPYARGSQIILRGNITSRGNSRIQRSGGDFGTAQINLEFAYREWDVQSGTTTVAVGIAGSPFSGIIKKGTGTLSFNSTSGTFHEANSYTGMTTIEEGVLKLAKNAGQNSIAGDITIKTGGILDWDQAEQIADTSSIYLDGGALKTDSIMETIANLYQSAGTINHNNDTANGKFTITGILKVTGGGTINLNSGGQWNANRFETESSKTGAAISLNGNSTTVLNRFHIGSGGLHLTGQSIGLSRATAIGGFGSELVLGGNFTGSGVNAISRVGGAEGVGQVNLYGGQRIFDVTSGTTTISANVVSTEISTNNVGVAQTVGGITKRGNGTLVLQNANTYTGDTRVEAGTLRLENQGAVVSPRITVLNNAILHVSNLSGGFLATSGQTVEGGGKVVGATTFANGSTLSVGTLGGDTTQTLTFEGALTLNAGSTTLLEIGSLSDYDQLIIQGNFLQMDGAKISVSGSVLDPSMGDIYQLFTFGGSRTFADLGALIRTGAEDNAWNFDLPDISASGLYWDLSNLASGGTVSVVPEPQKAVLSLLALSLLGLRRRRL